MRHQHITTPDQRCDRVIVEPLASKIIVGKARYLHDPVFKRQARLFEPALRRIDPN